MWRGIYLARCECISSSIELNPAVKRADFTLPASKSTGSNPLVEFRNRSRSEIFVVLVAGGSFVRCRPDTTTNV